MNFFCEVQKAIRRKVLTVRECSNFQNKLKFDYPDPKTIKFKFILKEIFRPLGSG